MRNVVPFLHINTFILILAEFLCPVWSVVPDIAFKKDHHADFFSMAATIAH